MAGRPSPVRREWVLIALSDLGGSASWSDVLERVAYRFGDLFAPDDLEPTAPGSGEAEPRWERRTRAARDVLEDEGLLEPVEEGRWALTRAGRAAAREAADHYPPSERPAHAREPAGAESGPAVAESAAAETPAAETPAGETPAGETPAAEPTATVDEPAEGHLVDLDLERPKETHPGGPPGSSDDDPLLRPGIVTRPLLDPKERAAIWPGQVVERMPVVVELNRLYRSGLDRAGRDLVERWRRVTKAGSVPEQVTEVYYRGLLSTSEMEALTAEDTARQETADRLVHRVWPDFPVKPFIDASTITIKADAAQRSFNASGRGIVWAVVDSGIDARHPHFTAAGTLDAPEVKDLHRDFSKRPSGAGEAPLVDDKGHGSHVAGIIAGGLTPGWLTAKEGRVLRVARTQYNPDSPKTPLVDTRPIADPSLLAGIARETRLVSLKVLDAAGDSDMSRLIAALAYVREVNAASQSSLRIHGVNLSVGYRFDPKWFACGHSPLCEEVNRLVRSGVVVVAAAGNTGYGTLSSFEGATQVGFTMTINDPGNADRAITVGSTHRAKPYTYGVSYFSSKGPTGDGRIKPDLVAPGERITSCAAGKALTSMFPDAVPEDCAAYVEETGTSMAAPHVSGAIAAFLSVRPEFVGEPERVKQVFLESTVTLGREPYFQGAGLLDLMKALQHV